MPVNVNDKIRKLSAARRKKVEARAAELIAEEMTLRELRKARKLTQVRVAKELGVSQDGVSRLEKRSDLLLSTLRSYVEAMGGHLRLIAEFPNQPPVVLGGLADMDNGNPPHEGRPDAKRTPTRLMHDGKQKKVESRATTRHPRKADRLNRTVI